MKKHRLLLAIVSLLLGIALAIPLLAQELTPSGENSMDSPFAGQPDLAAPEFPLGLDWINVAAPLTMEALRGKIVLLDFWTYGCINCIHMIPTLERLEEKYGDALQVIGVHSAKFANEGETGNLRQIVQRYGLTHPVINDQDFLVWRSYNVNAWPTFVVIDPRGNVLAMQAGEIPFEAFDQLIGGMIDFWEGVGELDRTPLDRTLEGAGNPPGLLAFPGKVLADAAGNRLFIADTNHHRIVVADLSTYEVLDVIGTGERGLTDGAFDTAAFNKPQGMALVGDVLYVADTENHVVRAVNLRERTVTTAAGTGVQSTSRYRVEDGSLGNALQVALSSPWDVTSDGFRTLYIANAGSHQIYALDLDGSLLSVAAGSGREALVNASPAASDLAQPSGLAYREGVLAFADAESSSIRAVNFQAGSLTTLAGTPANNLFDFGDVDGVLGVNRLQHPLGVTFGEDGRIYVADTYNSRIKIIDPATGETQTLMGQGGGGGFRDGALTEAAFDEPGGLSYANGMLYVADTNNHAVRVIDLASGQVSTVAFPNAERLQIGGRTTVIGGNQAQDAEVTLPAQLVAPGAGELVLTITLPPGMKINTDAPSQVEWSFDGAAVALVDTEQRVEIDTTEVRAPVTLTAGEATVHAMLDVYYCAEDAETLCYIEQVALAVPVTVADGAAERTISLAHTIAPRNLP
ncbi:MAG TPA: thioredoxin-like domain-containing protein [Candidatus Limnocylindrales bacterium]|nr:thioredoxin-like domain-containing protein [Candidatus Limnocylindrales bacterium]